MQERNPTTPGELSRREFVRLAALGTAAAACAPGAAVAGEAGLEEDAPQLSDHEALAYTKLDGLRVRCELCPRRCTVADRERGYCGVRENQGGTYKTLVYARPCALHVDPIEKKPLFHFLPSTLAFSIATAGCNVECTFCQNWRISQFRPEQVESVHCPPERVVALARREKCRSIAYTYSEPVIFYEYMLDCARAGNEVDVRSVMISNGYITAEAMKTLARELAAVKVDLKSFSDEFYRKYVHGELKPVLQTLELLAKLGKHTEIVVLIIPGLNDEVEEIRKMAAWVVKNLGADVPMHFTRFGPAYKMTNLSPTPIKTLERARETAAAEGVRYAYTGNVPGHRYGNTFCHGCGEKIISRYGHRVLEMRITDGKCDYCDAAIPGVWE